MLLQHGAHPGKTNYLGQVALHLACAGGDAPDDLLTLMVQARGEDGWSIGDHHVRTLIVNILSGSLSASFMLGNLLYRLLTDADFEAALLVPAGADGPAFLVYPNFRVIKRWNNSDFYALAVGHLADRIVGGGALERIAAEPPERMRLATVKAVQERLNALGYEAGEVDGILGGGTRAALRAFQADRDLVADGHLDGEVLEALEIDPAAVVPPPTPTPEHAGGASR